MTTKRDKRMKFGVMMFATDQTIQPHELGPALEERGFESLWLPEHSHIPTSQLSSFGGRPGGPPPPDYYRRTYESFVVLGAIAAMTTTLRLASGIALVAERDPLWLAKEAATVDVMSSGRFILGIGYGWNKEELAHHGVAYEERRAVLRERVLAVKTLWEHEEASFAGEHVQFSPSWAWPKPVASPQPPIVMGAGPGPKTFAHVAEFCDGWMPNYGRYDLPRGIELLHRICEAEGRDPASVEIGVTRCPTDAASLEGLTDLGISRGVFSIPHGPRDEVLAYLDELAALVDSWCSAGS